MMVKDISTAEHYRWGAAVIELGGRRHEVRERQGIEVAPGVPHQVRNESRRGRVVARGFGAEVARRSRRRVIHERTDA